MRELEDMMAEWRRSLPAGMREDVIDEIEDHLRQKVAELTRRNDLQTAFVTALREIGPPAQIAAEFAKVETKLWWPIKVGLAMLCVTAVLLPGLLIARLHDRPLGLLLGVHVFTITLGYLAVFMIGMFGSCYVFQRCAGEFPSAKANRIANIAAKLSIGALVFVAIGVALGAVWAQITWGRAWSNDPKEVGGACVLAWTIGFIAAQRSRAVSAKALMLFAVFGSIVVSAAWVGANYLVTHSEFLKAQFLALLCLHAVPFMIGLLPAGWLRLIKQST
ncbi:MAG TPA: cytochrome c biogenesis protein CcsA [Verrucomicrobiae bacterium]